MLSQNSQFVRVRDEAVDSTFRQLTAAPVMSADAVIDAYRTGIQILLRRAMEDGVLDQGGRLDLEVEITRRILGVINHQDQFTQAQLENLFLLAHNFATFPVAAWQVWREEAVRRNLQNYEGLMAVDPVEFTHHVGNTDWRGLLTQMGNHGDVSGDDASDETSSNSGGSNTNTAAAPAPAVASAHPNNADVDDDDDDCIMYGMYAPNDPRELPYKCLLCRNHQGIKHKTSFKRHFAETHHMSVTPPR